MERKTAKVLGYDVDLKSFDEALSFVENSLSNNKGLYIVTINPEIIEYGNRNKDFGDLLRTSDLTLPDGVGIKIALMLKSIKQETIPGVDFSFKLLKSTTILNKKVALIGAKEEVIQKAVAKLQDKYKGLEICYTHNGYFADEQEIIDGLRIAQPDLVLVALGAPKQDLFINNCRKTLQKTVFIGVGGSFDVWAGTVERAPKFYKKIGCEWLYRTIKQPQRFKRIYKTLPLFLFKAIIEAIKYKWCMCLKGKQ